MTQSKSLILAVDDEPHMLELMKRILEPTGYEVITASDGMQALALVAEKHPELVLLDIKMPGKLGTEVLQEVVRHHQDSAVIMVTAVGDIKSAVDAMKMGAFDYLMKPFDPDQMGICVQKALERRRLLLENRAYQDKLGKQLSALNDLFQSHLNLRKEVEESYLRLFERIAKLARELESLRKEAESYSTWIQIPPAERHADPKPPPG